MGTCITFIATSTALEYRPFAVYCILYIHFVINYRLENATRQLEEVQASREEELGQLERSVTRMGELEKELAEEKQAAKVRLSQIKTKQEQELKTSKEKLAK